MTKRQFECGYCGAVGPATDDHVPPKTFFEGVSKEQLRTVKSCYCCNNGASPDDEYFRDTVVKYYRVADQSIAKPIVDKMLRAAALPAKRKYAEAQLRSFTGTFVLSSSAPGLGPLPAMTIDAKRMERAARRYVRGLHRYDFGERVGAHEVPVVITDPEAVYARHDAIVQLLRAGKRTVVQDDVFEYVWAEDSKGMKACVMVFFREYAIFAAVGTPPAAAAT